MQACIPKQNWIKDFLQNASYVIDDLLRFIQVKSHHFVNKAGHATVLQALQLLELIIKNSLQPTKGKKKIKIKKKVQKLNHHENKNLEVMI